MAQYGTLLREQVQLLEGAPSGINYSIYPSPDRCKQNSIGMNPQLKNNNPNYYGRSQSYIDEQNYLLKTAAVKELQESNMNLLNTVNYNNQELWDELNINATDPAYVQNVHCPTYLPQETINITQPQKSVITYGNVTPLSPNNNELYTGYGDGIAGNKIIDGATFITDINSQAFKENIDAIQQQKDLIGSIDNNVLSFTSSLTIPDLKAINSGKLNLITNTNNEEIMAANTLLGPKSNVNSEPLLTDVVLMPANSFSNSYSSISQESVLPTVTTNSLNASMLPTHTAFPQNYQKVSKDFYSPVLSPAISQIYSNKALGVQAKTMPTNPKAVEYEKINKLRKNTVPLIKTTINKKSNKYSKSFSAVNLKTINPLSIKSSIVNKNKMDIDVNNIPKEKEIVKLNNTIVSQSMDIENTLSSQSSSLLLNKTPLVAEPLDVNAIVMTPNISSSSVSSSSSVDDIKPVAVKEDVVKKEEENNEKLNKSEVVKMEIEKSEVTLKKEEKEAPKEELVVSEKKENEDKKETKSVKADVNNKPENIKKKENKKEVTLPEKVTKEKSEDKKEKDKSSSLKETEINKKDKKDTTNDNSKPKKRPRFSAKNAKNDPAAIEAHVLLKRKRNTEAARRSRQRKVQQMKNLEETVQRLTKELEQAKNELKDIKEKYEKVVEDSKISKEASETKIKFLEEQLKIFNP